MDATDTGDIASGTRTLTMNDSVNITGHTSQVNTISTLGKDPKQWRMALREMQKLENGPRKNKLMRHFFSRADRSLNSFELRTNHDYAMLLGEEALFYAQSDTEEGRNTFQASLATCPKVAILYIMFAQFELDQGRSDKALKILKHGELCQDNIEEIIEAKKKLEQGFTKIVPDDNMTSCPALKNITNSVKNFNEKKISPPSKSIPLSHPSCKPSENSLSDCISQSLIFPSKQRTVSDILNLHSPTPPPDIDSSFFSKMTLPPSKLTVPVHQSSAKPVDSQLTRSKKKVMKSPVSSRTFPSTWQTTGKKFAPSSTGSGPRRVLVKKKLIHHSDSDSDKNDSPEEIKPNIINAPPNGQEVSKHPNLHSSAFKPYSKIDTPWPTAPPSQSEKVQKSDDKENVIPKFDELDRNEVNKHEANRNVLRPSHSLQKPEPPSFSARQEDNVLHPVFQKLQEKKVVEVNGVAYIILKLLGKGGSSKVYQGLNPTTSDIVAVKQVNLVGCESSVLEGYKNEINFLKKLQGNSHIIKLIDYEIRERHLYLVMECGSLDLSAFLKKKKAQNVPLDIIDILAFWKNMLKAVDAIHKHSVIHLDLKPANFMLVDYTLKLIDFGIANSIQVDATSVIKDTQFGTLNYMAPETINDLSGGVQTGASYAPQFKVGPKADVWSLGCILYFIMYGKTPFQHIHHQGMKLAAITNENHKIDFPAFSKPELVEIVMACLIRDPKRRPSVEILLNHPLLK